MGNNNYIEGNVYLVELYVFMDRNSNKKMPKYSNN